MTGLHSLLSPIMAVSRTCGQRTRHFPKQAQGIVAVAMCRPILSSYARFMEIVIDAILFVSFLPPHLFPVASLPSHVGCGPWEPFRGICGEMEAMRAPRASIIRMWVKSDMYYNMVSVGPQMATSNSPNCTPVRGSRRFPAFSVDLNSKKWVFSLL